MFLLFRCSYFRSPLYYDQSARLQNSFPKKSARNWILTWISLILNSRYLISRGYGQPQDKDSGGSDDDMSDEGTDDTLPSSLRERMDGPGHRLEFLIGDHVLPYDMTVYQVCTLEIWITNYCEDLNTKIVWYLNGWEEVRHQRKALLMLTAFSL